MKFLDLFAGIGGFRLGMEAAGHECVGYVEFDKFARKSYQEMYNTDGEWTRDDISKVSDDDVRQLGRTKTIDCITSGFPCQSFSIAGRRGGFDDTRGTLFFEVARFANILKPKYLFLENVKGLLNHDKGRTFRTILNTLDELGYNAEWQLLNSKDFGVPQNRERVFIIGHIRGGSGRQVFPITGKDESNNKESGIKMIGNINPSGRGMNGSVYSSEGISPTLNTNKGEGAKIAIKEATKKGYDEAGIGDAINFSQPNSKTRRGRVGKGVENTLETSCNQGVAIPVLTPDRINKRQNGRRFKENGEPSFTVNTQDKHGVYDGMRIRKLTPKETFRLQGFPDHLFHKAESVNSNSQLYKQAGNAVSVPVIEKIARELE